jgi:hypothetical protein
MWGKGKGKNKRWVCFVWSGAVENYLSVKKKILILYLKAKERGSEI